MTVYITCLLFTSVLIQGVLSTPDPYFHELKNYLPVNLNSGEPDKFLCVMIPIQKVDNQETLVEAAEGVTNATNDAVSVVVENGTIGVKVNGSKPNFQNIKDFITPQDKTFEESDDVPFNFQVPYMIPVDFIFRYDESVSSELKECETDTRTWKETVMDRISKKITKDGWHGLEFDPIALELRKKIDTLATLTSYDLTSTDILIDSASVLISAKTLSDIKFSFLINNTNKLNNDNLAVVSEAVDTYQLFQKFITLWKNAATTLGNPNQISLVASQVQSISDAVNGGLGSFEQALEAVRELALTDVKNED